MKNIKKTGILMTLLTIILIVIVYFGISLKKRFNTPQKRINNANVEVENLEKNKEIQEGDLIFQTSLSGQSKAIQVATKSKYSHCGIIFKDGDNYFVFEAVQPVKSTPLNEWIARGKDGKYVIKRLKNFKEVLTPEVINKMKKIGKEFNGKKYDLTFEWSDERLYCSELIWKLYERATGIEIGELQKLSDFDLTSKVVKEKLTERYGDKVPMDEPVISPAAIFSSELLIHVKQN